jgi:hypothetical protein
MNARPLLVRLAAKARIPEGMWRDDATDDDLNTFCEVAGLGEAGLGEAVDAAQEALGDMVRLECAGAVSRLVARLLDAEGIDESAQCCVFGGDYSPK